jgi:hypothetical protein
MQGVIDHGDGVDERGGERRVCVCGWVLGAGCAGCERLQTGRAGPGDGRQTARRRT